jgi:hypothetical protein
VDPAITADERQTKRQRRPGDNAVWQIRHFGSMDLAHRIDNSPVERSKHARCPRIVNRCNEPVSRNHRYPSFLHYVGQLNKANRRHMDGFAVRGRLIEDVRRISGKSPVTSEVPDDRVRIDDYRGHQKSSRGKFFHLSRLTSSMSSADNAIPRSAHKPFTLLNGFFN